MTTNATTRPLAELMERILWTARSAGATLIISRGHDPEAIRLLLEQGFIRERLGHLVLTPKGTERRRACAPN
ncbi:hypothetical protein [Sphingomonas sp.]|jgi:hypothetical protein|uniref:hypothetical protein n=1 Tax=Sphingomonas sp. TaxID=28214 RepID=UPI0035C81BCB